jgi:hypothetical protein
MPCTLPKPFQGFYSYIKSEERQHFQKPNNPSEMRNTRHSKGSFDSASVFVLAPLRMTKLKTNAHAGQVRQA